MTGEKAEVILRNLGCNSRYDAKNPERSWTEGRFVIKTYSQKAHGLVINELLKSKKVVFRTMDYKTSNTKQIVFFTQAGFIKACNILFKNATWAKEEQTAVKRIIGGRYDIWTTNKAHLSVNCSEDFLIKKAEILMKELNVSEEEAEGIAATGLLT